VPGVFGPRRIRRPYGLTAVLSPPGEVAAHAPLDAPGLLAFDMPAGRG
jgi:hypothetical protein